MDLSATPGAPKFHAMPDTGSSDQAPTSDRSLIALARRMAALRKDLGSYFPKAVFHDEIWDVIFELYIAECEGRETSVKQAVLSTGLPSTSALRVLERLEKGGLLERRPNEADHRRVNVRLSEKGRQGLNLLLRKLAAFRDEP